MDSARAAQNTDMLVSDVLYAGAVLREAAYLLLGALCLLCLGIALYRGIRRRWDSACYVLLCGAVLAWALCSFFSLHAESPEQAACLRLLAAAACVPLPALLCLHTHRQVSYREPSIAWVLAMFAVPAVLWLAIGRDLLFPGAAGALPPVQSGWWYGPLYYLYAAGSLVRGYLLCFSVFYQMPRRMRGSTQLVLLSITCAAALLVLHAMRAYGFFTYLIPAEVAVVLLPLAECSLFFPLVYPLYAALRNMPAADIIATSREFVMGGLDTVVMVLNRQKQILDWNRAERPDAMVLPVPKFREPFDVYRGRVLQSENCRVSPHNENIVILGQGGGREAHFLLRTHELGSQKRNFGYLVEIAEITPAYNVLRYFEGIAHNDLLTGMNNRNAYLHFVERVVRAENLPLLIFVGDVDGLKQVNDHHGHLAGDALLTEVAGAIAGALPPGGFAARVGGDEFVALIPRGSEETAARFARDVMERCSRARHEVFGPPAISWGYAVMKDASKPYNEVFSEADAMMYAYKKGRHQFSSSGLIPEEQQ